LKQYGVWDYIKRVTGEKDIPSVTKLFGFEFETDGNSGGLTMRQPMPTVWSRN
jgi:hypothetical protein